MVIIIFLFIVIVVVAITCGILRLCKKEEDIEGRPTYSVAISNRLFKGDRPMITGLSFFMRKGERQSTFLAICTCPSCPQDQGTLTFLSSLTRGE